jgi:glycosyltransferase involved in cell wall biosynthesis
VLDIRYEHRAVAQDQGVQQLLLVIPVFNDWESFATLLTCLDQALAQAGMQATVLGVDDGSTRPDRMRTLIEHSFQAIAPVHLLRLRRNLGHQRAIAIGLAYAQAHYVADMVVVMDSDGEDTPEETIRLIRACAANHYEKIVFARRAQRSESWLFRSFYWVYRKTYRLLTGADIRVGNFSVIPFALLHRLVSVSEIWSHYAAGVLRSRLPHVDIPTCRGYRYHGKSTMNFVALVTHGLSAIAVHGEIVGARLLVASCLLIGMAMAGLVAIIGVRLLTNWAIPGWSSYLAVALISVILQAFIMSVAFMFLVLVGRNNTSFLPHRDYEHFVLRVDEVWAIV